MFIDQDVLAPLGAWIFTSGTVAREAAFNFIHPLVEPFFDIRLSRILTATKYLTDPNLQYFINNTPLKIEILIF